MSSKNIARIHLHRKAAITVDVCSNELSFRRQLFLKYAYIRTPSLIDAKTLNENEIIVKNW